MISGITRLKFPFPSRSILPSRKTGILFSISLPVPGRQKAFPAHPCSRMIELLEPYDPQGTRSLIFRRKEHNMDSSEAGEEGCHAANPNNSNREGDSRLARSRTHGPGGEEFHAL